MRLPGPSGMYGSLIKRRKSLEEIRQTYNLRIRQLLPSGETLYFLCEASMEPVMSTPG